MYVCVLVGGGYSGVGAVCVCVCRCIDVQVYARSPIPSRQPAPQLLVTLRCLVHSLKTDILIVSFSRSFRRSVEKRRSKSDAGLDDVSAPHQE